MKTKGQIELDDWNYLVIKFLDAVSDSPTFDNIRKAKLEIDNLSNACKRSPLYRKNKFNEKKNEYIEHFKDCNKKDRVIRIYLDLLEKIVNAPTRLFADGSLILLIPILQVAIEEAENEGKNT